MGFLADTETSITSGFTAVATTFGSGLLGAFRPAFIVGFSIWIMLIAYETAFGKSEDGMTYILTKLFRMFLIGTIALWGWPEVADLLGGIKDSFVGTGAVATILETRLIDPITLLYQELFRWYSASLNGLAFYDIAEILQVMALFLLMFVMYGLMTLAVGLIATISLALFLVANSVFILLLAIGPFFLLCLAFPFTQRFFETYIGNVMTSVFGMGFTVLMINFVSAFFGLTNIHTVVPTATDSATIADMAKQMAVLFAGKVGVALLMIYLYYKIFDLAAALGGGLNMGNNMIGAARNITRDALGTGVRGGGVNRTTNQVNQGSRGGGAAASGGAPARSSAMDAIRANRTFTGMGISGVAAGARAVGRAASAGVRGTASVGRYAYNRYSSSKGGNSISG